MQTQINSVTANFRVYVGLVVESQQPVILEKQLLRILVGISLRPELERQLTGEFYLALNAAACSLPSSRTSRDCGRIILQLYNAIYDANQRRPPEARKSFSAVIGEANRLIQLGQAQVMRATRVRMDQDLFRVLDIWVQQLGDAFLLHEWAKLAPRLQRAVQSAK